MKQELQEDHNTDPDGNPTGGFTAGTGIVIMWQNGPLGRGQERKPANGAFVEGVIQAAIGRLEFYQASKFACIENEDAIRHLQLAMLILESRTRDRETRSVEGTHEV